LIFSHYKDQIICMIQDYMMIIRLPGALIYYFQSILQAKNDCNSIVLTQDQYRGVSDSINQNQVILLHETLPGLIHHSLLSQFLPTLLYIPEISGLYLTLVCCAIAVHLLCYFCTETAQ
jgi:hypothetical protein